jgi:hypothetical protein
MSRWAICWVRGLRESTGRIARARVDGQPPPKQRQRKEKADDEQEQEDMKAHTILAACTEKKRELPDHKERRKGLSSG